MKISEILKTSKKAFPSIEIVPPLNGMDKEELLNTVKTFMEFSPKYINVTCHRDEYSFRKEANGTYTKHLVRNRISEVAVCTAIMSKYEIDVVPHIICGGASAEELESDLYNYKFLGIRNVMALRGDSISGEKRFTPHPHGYKHANELVAAIRKFDEETAGESFCIGVGGYPEKHFEAANIETDIENLKRKVDAGADYVITQLFFDNEVFYRFERQCREAGIDVPIIPGLKPLSTAKQVELLPQSFSLDIPKVLTERIAHAGDDKDAVYEIGLDWCKEQCKDLLKHGVPAVHFYTMGKTKNITAIMKECF